MCTTCCRASASLEARLENSSLTYFTSKQSVRSWHVSHSILHLLILWRNQQTEVCLVLRSKPRNRRSNFEAQITKLELSVLSTKPGNHRSWFWGLTKKLTPLISSCIVQTAHGVTRPPDRPVTEYPTYAWPSPILCTRSPTPATILVIVRHVTPTTCTPRDKQTRFSTQTKIKVKLLKCPGFKFKPRHLNDSS
jgi:hypothetical protein